MNKNNDIMIKRNNEIFFLSSSDIEISFRYEYFKQFIEKYELSKIFDVELCLDDKDNRFKFNLVPINKIDMYEDILNSEHLFGLEFIKDKYLKENIIFFWNNLQKSQMFIFFPFYKKDNDNIFYNDFLNIKNEENIKVDDYISTNPIFNRNWIVICLEI